MHEDQTCDVEGRRIQWNIGLVRDFVHWVGERRVGSTANRGKQGCPASSLLFVLYIEPLGAVVRADPGVVWLCLPGGVAEELKEYAYIRRDWMSYLSWMYFSFLFCAIVYMSLGIIVFICFCCFGCLFL